MKVSQFIKHTLFFSTAFYLVIYLWIVYNRLQYPFELEWIEGGMVDQVKRIVNGQGIYVAPGIDFVPFLYTPIYFYLSAAVSAVFGCNLFSLRFVSLVASLVSFASIFLIVRNETRNGWIAFLSVGLFAATFRSTGAWLDIARVDSLFLSFWLLFIYFIKVNKSLGSAIIAGAFAAMAFLTKQTALLTCLPVIVYLFTWNWKYASCLLTAAILITGGTTLIFDQTSGGWYTYYAFHLQFQQTEWLPLAFASFWKDDLLVHLPLATLFTLFFFVGRPTQNRFVLNLWLFVLIGGLAGTFITRVKVGGYDNVLLPVYAAIAILAGLGLNEALETTGQLHSDYRDRIKLIIQVSWFMQLVILFYNPYNQIPTTSDLNAGYQLVKLISKADGDVYLPDHSYLSALAGKNTFAHHSAIWDVVRGNQQTLGKTLLNKDLEYAIQHQIFDVIIFDSGWNYCCGELNKYYTRKSEVFQDETVFYPVTGWKRRPTHIYVAKRLQNSFQGPFFDQADE